MRKQVEKLSVFLGLFIFLICLTLWNRQNTEEVVLASQTDVDDRFEKIACPTRDEIKTLISEFQMKISFQDFKCETQDLRTPLIKALSVLSKLNTRVPEGWGADLGKRLNDIKAYFRQYVNEIKVDQNLSTSTVVSTYPAEKIMELTHRIRELYPIELVSMLYHEVRHMEAPHKVHVRCGAGDMRGAEGACDEMFTLAPYEHMASYNTEILFLSALSLFNNNIDEPNKQLAAKLAMGLMATRFNNFRDNTVAFHDVIVGLSEDGKADIWHPYAKTWIPVPVSFGEDKITKIQTHPDAFSISIFSESGAFRIWSLTEGLRKPNPAYQDLRVQDADRMIVPALNGDTYTALISNGQLKILSYAGPNQSVVLKNYPYYISSVSKKYEFEKMIFGLYTETFLITKDGKLIRTARSLQHEDLMEVPTLNKQGPWQGGAGGLMFEDIYFVNKRGELFTLKIKNKSDVSFLRENELDPESYLVEKVKINGLEPLKKYAQGSQGEYYLGKMGRLYFKSYHDEKVTQISDKKLKDFAIIRTVIPQGLLRDLLKQKNREFSKNCGVNKVSWDPILYKGMGVNLRGELVFADFQNRCLVMPGSSGVLSYRFVNNTKFGESFAIPITSNGINFKSWPALELNRGD